MRTCETAAGVFGDSGGSADSGELLMLAKTGQPHVRSKHGPITRPGNLPFLAEELCRERMGARLSGRGIRASHDKSAGCRLS